METKKIVKWSIIGVLILLLIIILFNSFKSVPTGFVGVKIRFGKVQDTVLQEGLNGKLPFIEKINLIDCRTKKIEVNSEGSTKDMQTVNITIVLNYNINIKHHHTEKSRFKIKII